MSRAFPMHEESKPKSSATSSSSSSSSSSSACEASPLVESPSKSDRKGSVQSSSNGEAVQVPPKKEAPGHVLVAGLEPSPSSFSSDATRRDNSGERILPCSWPVPFRNSSDCVGFTDVANSDMHAEVPKSLNTLCNKNATESFLPSIVDTALVSTSRTSKSTFSALEGSTLHLPSRIGSPATANTGASLFPAETSSEQEPAPPPPPPPAPQRHIEKYVVPAMTTTRTATTTTTPPTKVYKSVITMGASRVLSTEASLVAQPALRVGSSSMAELANASPSKEERKQCSPPPPAFSTHTPSIKSTPGVTASTTFYGDKSEAMATAPHSVSSTLLQPPAHPPSASPQAADSVVDDGARQGFSLLPPACNPSLLPRKAALDPAATACPTMPAPSASAAASAASAAQSAPARMLLKPTIPVAPYPVASSPAIEATDMTASPFGTNSAASDRGGSVSPASSAASGGGQATTGRWTREEHDAFLEGLKIFGREWKKVATRIPTRTSAQIRSHAQKYFARLAREERQHRVAAAAAAAVAAHQPLGLAASSACGPGGMGRAIPVAANGASNAVGRGNGKGEGISAPEDLPPSVMQNVERILADPTGVQKEVERTLGALRERYRQLQERLEEQQTRRRPSPPLQQQPRQRDPRGGRKVIAVVAAEPVVASSASSTSTSTSTSARVAPRMHPSPWVQAHVGAQAQGQAPPKPKSGASDVGGKKRTATEMIATDAAVVPAAASAPNSTDVSAASSSAASSCIEIRSAELIALQVLGGTLPRSGSRNLSSRPSLGSGSSGTQAGRFLHLSDGPLAADSSGRSGGVTGSGSPSSVASIDTSSEMKDEGGDDCRSDAKRQRTME